MVTLLKRTFKDFMQDECPRMAASMSYFTAFSLAPLLVLILMVLGVFVDPQDFQGRIQAQVGGLVGADGARQINDMITAANRPANRGILPTVLGIAALLFGATGAFGELQSALNRAWEVKPDPRQGGLKAFLGKRVMSLGLVATIAFLLLVSLVVSAAIGAFGDVIGEWLGGISQGVMQAAQLVVSLGIITALFALIFKVLPDARIAWRDAWIGAAFTTVLFVAGKYGIAFYLAKSDPGSSFGAAGAFAILLVWIYYSSMILFLGAEFTQAWATEKGHGIEPEEGAVRVLERGRRALDQRDEGIDPAGLVAGAPRARATGQPRIGAFMREAPAHQGHSVADLLGRLSGEGRTLVRQEIALARAEMTQKTAVYLKSLASIGIGGGLLLGAFLLGLWALNTALTALLARFLDVGLAVWVAPLLLTAGLCAAGWTLGRTARARLARELLPGH